MQDTIRKSGIKIIGDVTWGTHFCQFYQTKQDLIDILVPYFKAGLENNEFCMWVTADNLTAMEARKAISKALPDISNIIKKGQIEILPYKEWYLEGGSFNNQKVLDSWVEKLNQAQKKGYDGLRLSGNTFWLEQENWRSFTDYEEAINNVIGKYNMIALCTYCLDRCSATEIVDVIRNHEFAMIKQAGKWELFENSRYKATKEALAGSEKRFFQLYHSMTEGLAIHEVIYNRSGKAIDYVITDVNPVYEQMVGLKADIAIGRKASEVYGTGEPPYLDVYDKVASTGESTVFDTYFPPIGKYFSISVFSPEKGKFATVFSDITERKKNEQKLVEQATMLANAGDAIIGYDADYHITYWNPGAEKIYGYGAAEAMGQISNVLLKPTYSNITREDLIRKVISEGHLETASSRLAKDGRNIDVETHIIVLRDNNGKTTGYVAVDRDITERKQMEKKLAHLASFPELNPTPVIEINNEGGVEYANAASKKLFPDLIEKGNLHPYLVGLLEIMRSRSLAESGALIREVEVAGQYYEQGVYIIGDGQHIRIYGFNITERKLVEEALRESQRDLKRAQVVANIGNWRLDIRHDELLWSDETYQIFGIPKETKMTYELFLSTIYPEDREYVDRKWRAALTCEPYDIEHRIFVDDKVKWVREKADLEFDEEGNLTGGFGTVQDITERKLIEENLLREKTFSETTINSLPGVFYLFKEDGKFLRWNRNFEKVTGYSTEEFSELNPLELFDSEEKVLVASAIHRVFTEGKVDIEANLLSKDGKKTAYYFTGIRMLDDDVPYLIGSGIDISERKQAEELLRETSNYLNNLFDYANAPIIVWDPQFRISRFNPAFERLTGYKSREVIGLGLDILFPGDMKNESLNLIRRTLSGERWEVVEIPILRVDGTVRIVLWNSANVYDNEGKEIIATIAQGQDITERKQVEEELRASEKRYRSYIEATGELGWTTNADGEVVEDIPSFRQFTGQSREEVTGWGWSKALHMDDYENTIRVWKKAVEQKNRYEIEYRLRRHDGVYRYFLARGVPVLREDGSINEWVGTCIDITERKKTEEEIKKLNEELERRASDLEASNKELEIFAYSVSHDLRAPLRSMEGFSQALLEDCFDILNDQCKDYLKRIQSSAELMAELIDDLLQLSRLTRANMVFNNVNLSEIAYTIAADLKKTQPDRKVEFVVASGLIAQGDEKLLNIVLYNLLENAWKFTSKSVTARIEFGVTEHDSKRVYFVRDNGVGFDMTYVDKIFGPFQRLHSTSEFPGTGIGLASVQRIIHRHGGQIWAEGKVGEGAVFYFTLD